MAWASGEIGKVYDFGVAVRPNPDGSVTPLSVKNAKGDNVQVTSIAYMSDTSYEQEESVDLIRKEQLTRLSSANVIDREFTLNPQATQGSWVGGELQRIFTDPTAYWQGRGLLWPPPPASYWPSQPIFSTGVPIYRNDLAQVFTDLTETYGVCAGGFLTNAGVGFAHGFRATSAAGTLYYIAFTDVLRAVNGASGTLLVPIPNRLLDAVVIAGAIYYLVVGDTNVYRVDYTAGAALNAPVVWATMPSVPTLITSSYVGGHFAIAVARGVGLPVRVFTDVAGTFADVPIPVGVTVSSMTISGSTLYIGGGDQVQAFLVAFDLVAGTTTIVAQMPVYNALKVGAAQGSVFVLAYTFANNSNAGPILDMYLLVSGTLQFISRVPPLIDDVPPNVSYGYASAVSNIVSMGPYACFAVQMDLPAATPPWHVICAYDVTRGTFFTAVDKFQGGMGRGGGAGNPIELAVVPGATAPNGAVFTSVTGDFAFGLSAQAFNMSGFSLNAMHIENFATTATDGSFHFIPLVGNGKVISSAIDFTSAAVKLFRQIVVTHVPMLNASGVSIYAWFDRDVDNLTADTAYKVTNNQQGSTVTTLPLNVVAKKMVYMLSWSGTPGAGISSAHPISVAIQAATGFVWTTQLAMHDKVMTYAGRTGGDTVWMKQNVDVVTAINFLRALWRQRGGLFIATLPNGDSYNAVLQRLRLHGKPLAKPSQAGHPALYEGTYEMVFAEDL